MLWIERSSIPSSFCPSMPPMSPGAPFALLHAHAIPIAQALPRTLLPSVAIGLFGHHGHVDAEAKYDYTTVIHERLLGYDKCTSTSWNR